VTGQPASDRHSIGTPVPQPANRHPYGVQPMLPVQAATTGTQSALPSRQQPDTDSRVARPAPEGARTAQGFRQESEGGPAVEELWDFPPSALVGKRQLLRWLDPERRRQPAPLLFLARAGAMP
jgi:hypothetical protein